MPSKRIATLALVALAAACSESTVEPIQVVEPITALPRSLSVAERRIIDASNDFGIDLLRAVRAANPDSTIFLSPLSASMALGMAMNGATGDTRSQMQEVLGFGDLTPDQINESYRDLIELLDGLDDRVDFRLVNAIFHRDSFQMEIPYLDLVQLYFGARLEGLDFDDPATVDHMNDWVRQATEDRIDGIVQAPIDPLTVAFLMNAIYFKGDWSNQFDPDDTYTGSFWVDGVEVPGVRYMTQHDTLPTRGNATWQAVDLPYGGGAWAMTIAVPRPGHELDAVLADLESVLDPAAAWNSTGIEIHIPRFELEWGRKLNDDLIGLGMVDAFDDVLADFTPMYRFARRDGLHIAEVKQKTFLKVDEVGTEAAAVTSVQMMLSCACGPPVFRADRPFLIAIRERLSGTVMFAGVIVQLPVD
jgi:serine protease inhibitor